MMARPTTFGPRQGGVLMSALSAETAGPANYSRKRDWRRAEMDQEQRGEGCDYFIVNPFPAAEWVQGQVYSAGQEVTHNEAGYARTTATGIRISGASDTVLNGDWTQIEDSNGKPAYSSDVPTYGGRIQWTGAGLFGGTPRWEISFYAYHGLHELTPRFYSNEDVATPDLVTFWNVATAADIEAAWGIPTGSGTFPTTISGITYPASGEPPTVTGFDSIAPDDDADAIWVVVPVPFGNQPFPDIGPINLNVMAVRPNGDKAIIIGSATTLARFNATTNAWDIIGTGFDPNGSRWEAVKINGYLCLNNASDLPVTYRVEDSAVVPMYELRDNGIAAVGTIAEIAGILVLMDIRQIYAVSHVAWMNGATPYGRYVATPTLGLDRYGFRAIWSDIDKPTRYDATIPCSTNNGSAVITLAWPSLSFSVGQELLVLGAGAVGGNLTGTVVSIAGNLVTMDTPALASISTSVAALDSLSSIVGFEDLQDDGSAILKGMELRGALIIYKETGFFMAQYTGVADAPFAFERLAPKANAAGGAYRSKALFYRHTLVSVTNTRGEVFHMYAGRDNFYRFDLVSRSPVEIETSEYCRNVFFDEATKDNKELIFATENSITHEIFFCFPAEGEDKALKYDYKYGTFSTTSLAISAGATVERPDGMDDWFIMGTSDGVMLIYGLVREGLTQWEDATEIFYRRTATPYNAEKQEYVSSLMPGYLGGSDEIQMNGYTLNLSSRSPDAPVRVNWVGYGADNLGQQLGYQDFDAPANNGGCHIATWFIATFIQEEITVREVGSNVLLASRTIYALGLRSMGANLVTASRSSEMMLASSSGPSSSSLKP